MIGDAIERLFEVKQGRITFPKIIMTLVLFLVLSNMLFIFFAFEDRAYSAYKEEYGVVKNSILEYKNTNGEFPLGEMVDWGKEKDLHRFLTENRFTMGSAFYYIDFGRIENLNEPKMKYIIDLDREILYTSQSVPYKNKRWHIPMAD